MNQYIFVQRQVIISRAAATYFVLQSNKLSEKDSKIVEDAMTFM